MPIKIACQCGRQLMVPDNRAGRSVQCPKCAQRVPVPGERQPDPEPTVLPTAVPAVAAVEKPVVAPQPVMMPPPIKPESPATQASPAQKQKQEKTPAASQTPPAPVAVKPTPPTPPPAGPAPPPAAESPPALEQPRLDPVPKPAPTPPPLPSVTSSARQHGKTAKEPPEPVKKPIEKPLEKPIEKKPAAASVPVLEPVPVPVPPALPKPAPIPQLAETQAPLTLQPRRENVPDPPPAPQVTTPVTAASSTFSPAIDKLVSTRPGYRPDADKLSAAYVLAMLLVLLGVVSMVPGVLEVIRFLRDIDSWPVGRWAFVIFFLGLLHFAYAMYLGQLPDWSAAWVLTGATLLQGAVYGAVLTALYLVGGQSQLVEALDLGPHVDNGHARAWCFVMLCLNSVVAYYCGRVSMRWRRAFVLIRSAHRL